MTDLNERDMKRQQKIKDACAECKPEAPMGYRYEVKMRQSATTIHDISMVAVTENGDLILVRPDGLVEDIFANGLWTRCTKKVGLNAK